MKNLKIRIWDENEKKFIQDKELENKDYKYIKDAIEKDNLTINTGLLDINGKEIYEGDFVSIYNTYKEKYYKGIVKYHPANAEFILKSVDLTSHKRWINYEMKVVGNKYENPGYLVKFD
ncbi:MAG: hypothetical protein CSB15_00195 [Clostridiales bacterium]|nr:MAG: hypothetical protein CSB15_00195 [Clostridiales bacterium]